MRYYDYKDVNFLVAFRYNIYNGCMTAVNLEMFQVKIYNYSTFTPKTSQSRPNMKDKHCDLLESLAI